MARAENEGGQLLAKLLARALRWLDFSPRLATASDEKHRSSEGIRKVLERPSGLEIPCSIHLSYGRKTLHFRVFCINAVRRNIDFNRCYNRRAFFAL